MADNEVKMMMSVYPGAMTGFAALNAGLVSINNVLGNMTRAFDRQFDLLDTAITTTGVVVTQLGIDAMNAFGEFEQGMKIVQMVSGQTAQDIGYLSQKANEFSVQYRTDIDQITEGLQTLGRAGLNSATEQTEVLQNGLNTAKLEGRDLNSVLEELIQNTALLGGNLKSSGFGEESEYVNDLLVATSMTAPITTHDVSETLKYSGGIAAAAGANIESESGKAILEDYMGAIAAFAQKGVTGSIAGTALRAFFNKPATQDSSVKDALASIKLKPEYLWEDDEEVMKPVSEQIKLIQDQMDKLNVSTMDRLQIWSKIVGGKMGQQMMKLDSSDIKELTKDIRAADDASDLAAGSMKTYQANVKALGESGAALQRDVGEKLVYFVNPILEFMNKFTGFLDNDISASVLATSIIAFVGMLGKKIFDVIKIIKSELSTLMSGIKYNLSSKAGLAIGPDGKLVSSDGSEKGAPKNAMELAKQYYGFSKGTKIESLRKAGMTDADIARVGIFSTLKKDSTGAGMSDAEFVKKIYPSLSSAQKSQMDSLVRAAGGASRKPFDQMFLDEDKVLKEEYRDLAVKMGLFEESTKQATSALDAMKATFGNKTGVKSSDWKKQYARDAETYVKNQQAQAAQAAQAHATALGNEVNAEIEVESATNQVTSTVARGAATVVEDFNAMMAAISIAVKGTVTPSKAVTLPTSVGLTPTHTVVPSHLLNVPFHPHIPTVDPSRIARIHSMDGQFRKAMADHFNRLYNKPAPIINEKSDVEKRIDRAISQKNYQKNVQNPNADKPRMDYYQQAAYRYFKNNPQLFPAYGGYQGRLPSQEAIDASLKANKEAEIKATQQAAAEKQKETNLLRGQVAAKQVEIDQAEKLLIAEQQNAAAIDRMTASARTFVAVMEGNWPNKTANGIWSPGLTDKQKQDKEGVHRRADLRAQRLEYKEANKKFLDSYKSGVKGVSVAQTEAERFRQEAKKQVNQLRSMSNLSRDEFAAAGGRYGNQLSYLSKQYSLTPQEMARRNEYILSQNRDVLQRVQNNPIIMQNYSGNMGAAGGAKGGGSKSLFSSITKSGVYQNFMKRISDDRQGRFLAFGTSAMGKLGNKALNVADMFGGPLMIATIAVTAAIQMWQQAFQDYCEDLKEAGNKLKDAYSEWESAESALRSSYAEENPDATDEELDQKIYDTYDTMGDVMREAVTYGDDTAWLNKINTAAAKQPTYEYDQEADDGSVKIVEEQIDTETKLQESIKQNTGALYQATAEVSMALDNYVRQGTDSWWGINGWTGQLTDAFGSLSDFKDWWRIFSPMTWETLLLDGLGEKFSDNHFTSNRSKFMDEQEFLLTARQKDENYAGNTEMAGLMLQDFKDAGGNWLAGMQTMMGEDAITFSHLISDEAKTFLDSEAKFASRLTQGQNLKLQTSMKNDSKNWKQLAKEVVKNEMKTGKKTTKQNQTKKIEGLIDKLNKSMGNQFSHTQMLQATYLQIMQGMLEVAKTTIVPIIAENAQIAAQTMYNSGGIDQKANQSNSTTSGIGAINSSIAAMVSQIAMAKSAEATYNGILMQDPSKLSGGDLAAYKLAQESTDAQDFLKKAANASYNGASLNVDWGKALGGAFEGASVGASGMIAGFSKGVSYQSAKDNQKAMDDILTNFGMTALMQVYGYDAKTAQDKVSKAITDWRNSGSSSQQIYESLAKNYQTQRFYDQLNNAYVNSGEGEDEGSGSGSGSGSGDKDKNTGTRRERVDLVLCNKKEIPKLNVNLFKKPPSFTILNKNFKLRDVKINSEDKPKAIMAAIKNSFIDIQKRTDPKIIQDEDAVYDPKAATDGTNLPSGSAKTKTDNN